MTGLVLGVSVAGAGLAESENSVPVHSPPPKPQQTPDGQTVEESGHVLGVAIGMHISAAREKLDPLRLPPDAPPDVKEQQGKRIYWKLDGTEYEWIMAWANSEGEVTRLRARLRPDALKPFSEIGDLARATVNTPEQAAWNVTSEGRPAFRLIAQGNDRRAVTFYMFALGLEMR